MRACVRVCSWLLAVGMILAAPAVGWAQGQLGDKNGLKTAFDNSGPRWKKLLAGEEQPGKGDAEVAKAIANYHLYRLTHQTEPGDKLVTEFNAFVAKYPPEVGKARDNRKFLFEYLGPALVASMKDVLPPGGKHDRGMVVHAAMMLPIMARVKSEPVYEYFVDLANGKGTHDVVKLYALKAIRDALPIADQPKELDLDFGNAAQNARRKRDAKYVDGLKTYIEQPVNVASMSYEEASAVRFIRREAIIALAQAGAPAVLAVPKKLEKKDHPNPQGLVAPTLLRVLAGNIQPPPSSQEKIEAAIGLCNMKYPNMPEYNPALATYLIGQTIVDLSAEYSKDLQNFAIGKDKNLPYIAWKSEAARLKAGLDVFAKNANTDAAKKAAIELKINADSNLGAMMSYATLNAAKDGDLRRKVNDFRTAATDSVFLTLKAPPVFPQK